MSARQTGEISHSQARGFGNARMAEAATAALEKVTQLLKGGAQAFRVAHRRRVWIQPSCLRSGTRKCWSWTPRSSWKWRQAGRKKAICGGTGSAESLQAIMKEWSGSAKTEGATFSCRYLLTENGRRQVAARVGSGQGSKVLDMWGNPRKIECPVQGSEMKPTINARAGSWLDSSHSKWKWNCARLRMQQEVGERVSCSRKPLACLDAYTCST